MDNEQDLFAHIEKYCQPARDSLGKVLLRVVAVPGEMAACADVIEEWRSSLLLKIAIGVVRVGADLYKSIDEGTLPAVAWYGRNLLELWIWLKYCAASRENAWRFHQDIVRDSEGFTRSFFEICDLVGVGREMEPAMREKLGIIADRVGVDMGDAGYLSVADAARSIGEHAMYSSFNKYFSKIAHPTAFLLASMMQEPPYLRALQVGFTVNAVYFAGRCADVLEQFVAASRQQSKAASA